MAFDIKTDLMELGKEGIGDAVVQYVYNKYLGDKIVAKLGTLGKWADVGGSLLYGIGIDYVADNFGSDISPYLRNGAASQLGRAISVALGDPNPPMPSSSGASMPTEQGVSLVGRSKFSTLNPVPLE